MKKISLSSKIKQAVNVIRKKADFHPGVGIILGTGLGKLAEEIKVKAVIPYSQIPYFPVSTVPTHKGELLLGELNGTKVVAMEGRFHYYEGYDMRDITLPIRVMKKLGIKTLIVSNACGGLNPQFKCGDIMIITDHINLMGDNPLRGVTDERLGPRFPDMYNCYDKKLIELAEKVAINQKITVRRGVYVGVHGPNLETAAEYRFLRIIGGDAVGMSTVPEVIVAKQIGIKVLGFSVVTDMGLPDAMSSVKFVHVLNAANKAEPKLTCLIREVVGFIK